MALRMDWSHWSANHFCTNIGITSMWTHSLALASPFCNGKYNGEATYPYGMNATSPISILKTQADGESVV
eukprot:9503813-Pyramimonas_sp.AAC.3